MSDTADWKDLKPETILLSPEDYAAFIRALSDPQKPNEALVELLMRKPPWAAKAPEEKGE